MRPLQVWRGTASVHSPYIPMLRIQFIAITCSSSKRPPCPKPFLTTCSPFVSLSPRESPLVVCRLPYMFSKHKNKNKIIEKKLKKPWDFSWNGHQTPKKKTKRGVFPKQQTNWTATEVIVRSQSFLLVSVSDCCSSNVPIVVAYLSYSTFRWLLTCRVTLVH